MAGRAFAACVSGTTVPFADADGTPLAVVDLAAAEATAGDRETCLAAGMDDDITKPIRVDALVRVPMDAARRRATA